MQTRILYFLIFSAVSSVSFAEDLVSLPAIQVTAPKTDSHKLDATKIPRSMVTGDTAALLQMTPGVSLQSGGGISSLPIIHGLADDRVNIKIDGAAITSSCPNHMNPVLSYIDPSKVSTIETLIGITPVSYGGDSIGGSIIVESKKLIFASSEESFKQNLNVTTFYKSNNENRGASISYGVATEKISINYSGLDEQSSNYRNGSGDRIKGTLYNQNNQTATVGGKVGDGVLALKLSRAVVPYQGYVNQYMDLNDNVGNSGNLRYSGKIGEVLIDTNIFQQHTTHYMNKITSQRSGSMPMYTRSDELGYNLKAIFEINSRNILKVGSEYNQYRLDDWWPPVAGSMGMSPGTFKSINNGKRDRLGFYIEADTSWSSALSTNFGLRTDIVKMDTGDVKGYNTTNNLPADESAFNSQSRLKRDNNYDATLSTSYKLSSSADFDFGISRKTRSPNMYERYAWAGSVTDNGPAHMDMRMINWFGDGNGYVGDINLKPEVAHTLSSSLMLHDAGLKHWDVKITPYYTVVDNFIDTDLITSVGGVNYLRFANHDAILFGGDLSASTRLMHHKKAGDLKLKAIGSYTRGYRRDGLTPLYHLMPLNGKVLLTHSLEKWTTELTTHLVSSKNQVNKLRLEPKTAGYVLLDLSTSYQMNKLVRVDLAITNLLDHSYGLPLGGIDLINSTASSHTPLAGMGRSVNTALTIDFF